MARVAVIGDVAVDHYMWLEESQLEREKSFCQRSDWYLGGTGSNAAVALARLGSHAHLYGFLGDDPLGAWAREQLVAEDVDISRISIVGGRTTYALILFMENRRSIVVEPGVADLRISNEYFRELENFDVIYCSYAPETAIALARAGFAAKLVLGFESWMLSDPLLEIMPHFRAVIMNSEAFAAIGGWDEKTKLLETRGSEGVRAYSTDESFFVPAIAVNAVDPTGAGDAFAGALCHYMALGDSLRSSVEQAVEIAAMCTTAYGSQTALPNRRGSH